MNHLSIVGPNNKVSEFNQARIFDIRAFELKDVGGKLGLNLPASVKVIPFQSLFLQSTTDMGQGHEVKSHGIDFNPDDPGRA